MLRILVLLALASGPAHAGAWPRGAGKGFLASSIRGTSTNLAFPLSTFSTFYFEYGLTDRLTIGLDAGRGVSGNSKTVLFASLPLNQSDKGPRWAVEMGIGQIAGQAVVRPGLSFGTGFSAGHRSGWIAIDTFAEYQIRSKQIDLKADITFGLNYSDRLTGLVQIQTGASFGDPSFARLVPSIVLRTGRKTRVEMGTSVDLKNPKSLGLALGFWREF